MVRYDTPSSETAQVSSLVGVLENAPMRLLLIEDSELDIHLIEHLLREAETLDSSGETRFQLLKSRTLASALALLQVSPQKDFVEYPVDVVLLDLVLPDSQHAETLARFLANIPGLPVVVLTGMEENLGIQALRQGAEDYLPKKELNARTLVRALRYALERRQLRQELERVRLREQELQTLCLFRQASPAHPNQEQDHRNQAGNSCPSLREQHLVQFERLVASYESLMDLSLEQRFYKTDNQLPDKLARLGLHLGQLKATPGDVVDIHRTALTNKAKDALPKKIRTYSEEGRLLLLGVLAKLAAYYRNRVCWSSPVAQSANIEIGRDPY